MEISAITNHDVVSVKDIFMLAEVFPQEMVDWPRLPSTVGRLATLISQPPCHNGMRRRREEDLSLHRGFNGRTNCNGFSVQGGPATLPRWLASFLAAAFTLTFYDDLAAKGTVMMTVTGLHYAMLWPRLPNAMNLTATLISRAPCHHTARRRGMLTWISDRHLNRCANRSGPWIKAQPAVPPRRLASVTATVPPRG